MTELKVERAALVYQGGIANVFAVDVFTLEVPLRNARRIMQYDFRTCEAFAMGLRAAGAKLLVAHCNEAGDIVERPWSAELEDAPFSEQFGLTRSDEGILGPPSTDTDPDIKLKSDELDLAEELLGYS
jgi:hypothetical protein